MPSCSGNANNARASVCSATAAANTGQRVVMPRSSRSGTSTGRPWTAASMHAPSPRVNCRSSSVAAVASVTDSVSRASVAVSSEMAAPSTSQAPDARPADPSGQEMAVVSTNHADQRPGHRTELGYHRCTGSRPPGRASGRNGTAAPDEGCFMGCAHPIWAENIATERRELGQHLGLIRVRAGGAATPGRCCHGAPREPASRGRAPLPLAGVARAGSRDRVPMAALYGGLVVGGPASARGVSDDDIPTAVADGERRRRSRRWGPVAARRPHGTARWDRHGPPGSRAV